MKAEDLEAKIQKLEQKLKKLEAKGKLSQKTTAALETRMTRAEDVEAIKKLQRAYGFYLEHWQEDELIALFSTREDVTIEINDSGEFRGPEGVKQCYVFGDHYTAYAGQKTAPIRADEAPELAGKINHGGKFFTDAGRKREFCFQTTHVCNEIKCCS